LYVSLKAQDSLSFFLHVQMLFVEGIEVIQVLLDLLVFYLLKIFKELSSARDIFTPSDIERALWSSAVGAKLLALQSDPDSKKASTARDIKRKRKR